MGDTNTVEMRLLVTPQGLELFDQAGKKVADLGRAAKEAEQGFSLFSAKGAAAAVAVGGLATAVTGFAVAAGAAKAGMDAFTVGVARGSAFNDLSQRLGVSVETLSKLELAAKTSGVSLDGLGVGIQQLSRNMVEAASGGKEAQAAFAALGISAAELKSLNTEQVLGKIADSFAGANDGAAKTAIAMQLLGRAGAQMIPLLNEGSAGLQRFGELSERLGLTMTRDMAAAFDSIGDSMDILGSAVEGVQSQFAIGMAPALAEVSEALVGLVADMGIANGTIRGLGETVGGWLKGAFESLRGTIEETQGLFATLDFEDAMGIVGERLNKALESAFESAIWAAARAAKNVFMTAVEWAFGSVDISSVVASKNEELIREQVGNLERELSARYGSGGLEAARVDAPFDANVRNLVDNVDALKGRLGELAGAQLVAQAAASKNSAAMVDQQVAGNLAALGVNTAGDAWRFYEQAGVSAGKTNLSAPLKDTGDAAKKLGEDLQNASAALSAAQGIYEQAADGSITLAEANLRAAAASAVLAKGVTDEKAVMAALAIERQKAAIEAAKETAAAVEAAAASERRVAILDEAIAAGLSSAEAEQLLAQATIEAHAADILATTGLADKAEKYRKAAENARASAQAEKDRQAILSAQNRVQDLQLELSLTQQVNQGLISELDKKIAIARAQADGNVELEKRLVKEVELREAIEDQQTAYVHLGDVFKDSFEQAFDAVISGTRNMGDVLEGIGIGIGKRLFSAMLESKLKDFDPTVKANFLDLGEFGKSIFGDLFSGDSSSSSSSGSGDGLFKQAADWIGGLLKGKSDSSSNSSSSSSDSGSSSNPNDQPVEIIGQNADGTYIYSDGSEGYGQSKTAGVGGSSGRWGGAATGALAGGASGYASSSQFGTMLITGTGLPAALTQVNDQVVHRLQAINEVVSTILGAVFGGLVGGSAGSSAGGAGGIIGMVVGLFDSLVGQAWGDQVNRDVLRDRGFGGGSLGAWTPRIAGGVDSGAWDVVGATDPLASWVMFQLLGLPTLGTAFRQAGEGVIDSSPTFGGDNGKGGLQGLLGDWTRTGYATGEQTALDRGFSQSQVDAVSGGTQAIFSQLFKDSLPEDAGRLAEEQGQIMAEFLSRGLAEGLTYDQLFASLRQFAGEAGVTLKSAVEGLDRGFEQAKASAMEFGNLDPMAAGKQAADSYAQSLYGVTQVFKGDFPLGVNLASIALQTMEKDGVKAFENLDHNGKETLQNLTEDAESFQAVVAHLVEQGFTIDTEEFEAKVQAITESATFLGQNIGQIFNFDSASAGVDAIFQQLKGDIFSTFQGEAMKQLFNGTDIAAAFEPVYAVLDRIDEFDLTTATGSQGFMAELVPALAQGRANLEEYLPILQVLIDNWKEVQKVIDEAMKPDVFEQAATVAEEGFNGIGTALTSAIDAGVAVLEDGGTWDDAVKAFDQTFGSGVQKSFQDAIFKAIVQANVIDPLIATYQPAFQYVVAAGLIYGFDDPRVKAAFASLLGDVQSKAKGLGLLVFEAKVDSDGITSDIERAFNDAADIVTDWADGLKNIIHTGLNAAFDVIAEGGTRDAALAAWGDALGTNTRDAVFRGIVLALIDAAIIEPFIKQWAPVIQFWTAGALEKGINDPKVRDAADALFGPNSPFMKGLTNIGPVSIDFYGRIIGYTDENGNPIDAPGSGGGKNVGDKVAGHASGGSFRAGQESMFIVGEAGPELFISRPDGYDIYPLSQGEAASMLGGGVTGFADGTRPRGGDVTHRPDYDGTGGKTGGQLGPHPRQHPDDPPNTYYPPGFRPRGAPSPGVRPTPQPHPGSTGVGTIDVTVDLNLDDAIEAFLRGGSLKEFQDALDEATKKAVLDGVIKGMLESGPIKKAIDDFNKQMDDAVTKAMRDGVIDGQEQADLDTLAEKLAGGIETATTKMQPVVTALGKAFGLGVEASTKEAIDGISSDLDGAIRSFLEGGSVTEMADAINRSVYDATTSAIIQALITTGPLATVIDKFGTKVGKAISDALEDGTIDEKEARRIRRIGKKYGVEISDAIKALGPVLGPLFEDWAGLLGIDIKNEIVSIEGTLGNALKSAIQNGDSIEVLQQNIKKALYESVVDGMVNAFIDSAVIQGLLAGPMSVINDVFAQIADHQITVAEANQIILKQFGAINWLLNDPTFLQALQTFTNGINELRQKLGLTAGSIADGFQGVADTATDATKAECEWERRLVDSQEKNATLGEFGQQGFEVTQTYGPVKPDDTGQHGGADSEGTGNDRGWNGTNGIDHGNDRNLVQNRAGWHRTGGPGTFDGSGNWSRPGWHPTDLAGTGAATNGPVLVQDDGIAKLQREIAKLREAFENMPPPVVNLDGREISKNSRKHERRESRGGQSTQWGIS